MAMAIMDIIATLQGIELFAELRKPEIEKIARIALHASFPANARIFSEGEPGNAMYLVKSGRVRISRTPPNCSEEALAILGPGAVFGEMAVLDGGRRSADVIVLDPCELLVVERKDFAQLLFDDKELAYYVLSAIVRTLAGRLREMDEKLVAFFMMARFS
jgi:CRP/FNR family transcriptional regulator, cyclic AMP receptor protein